MFYEDELALSLVSSQSTDSYVAPRSSCPVLKRFPPRQQQRDDRIIYLSAKVEGYSLAMRVQRYMAMTLPTSSPSNNIACCPFG